MTKLTLDSSVQFLKGVGPKRREEFTKVGVRTVRDLLEYYPRSYVFAVHRKVYDAEVGEMTVIRGRIPTVISHPDGRVISEVRDDTGNIKCVWFNQPFMYNILRRKHEISVWGTVTEFNGKRQMVNPSYSFTTHGAPANDGSGSPIYPATKNLTSRHIENAVKEALVHVDEGCDDGSRYRRYLYERGYMALGMATHDVHQPPNKAYLKMAKKRLKYEEFYALQVRMKERRESQTNYATTFWKSGGTINRRIMQAFDFDMTGDQQDAIKDIIRDTCDDGDRYHLNRPMYRLLQGDVGSGKTAVAVYTALLAAVNGKQTVIMCPTKILARQHYEDIKEMLENSRFNVCLLTSDTANECMMLNIRHMGYHIVVSTTSALSGIFNFKHLGLLIIDEEHRFGVKQKDKLIEKYHPHQLYMSATPIPKALTATAFGDLDVSTVKQMPEGRGERSTYLILPQFVENMWDSVFMPEGKQELVYDVYPRIEGPGGLLEARDNYLNNNFTDFAIIHGRRRDVENKRCVEQFRDGLVSMLLCTSMVEAGVHVPDANTMIVHEAHMFGLSQLHQLRGRIGRSSENSRCFLLCDTDNQDAIDRLKFLEHCDDGFVVAMRDLKLRGPGELLGHKQHGMPELKLADLITDYSLLCQAREDVRNGIH